MTFAANRLGLLDAIKAVASNLIVLHHLAFYGPMSDRAAALFPGLFAWLASDARIAVQAFLVLGGFLAARSLAVPHVLDRLPSRMLLRRYVKLAGPFMAAMLLAAGASELARLGMRHESISAPASMQQLAAHALLLHDVLGYEALSAGAWYVAIDFQLYALLLATLWLVRAAGGRMGAATVAVAVLAALSLWQLNLAPEWDAWAPYFFGSYGLGVLAWWACVRERAPWLLTGLILVLAGIALLIEFRSRVTVAAAVALMLIATLRLRLPVPGAQSAVLSFLGRISYSVFLVHFPVCLLVNAAFTRFAEPVPAVQLAGVVLGWAGSVAAGYGFHRWVEVPFGDWAASRIAAKDKAEAARAVPGS